MTQYAALDQFLNTFQTAKNYNSKEIRLTIQEAEQISIAIGKAMIQIAESSQIINDLHQELSNSSESTEIHVSGGKF